MFEIRNQGFDHVEFAVEDIDYHSHMYKRMGFEKIAEAVLENQGVESKIYAQGSIRIVLTKSLGNKASEENETIKFHKKHGDGITVLGLDVGDAAAAWKTATENGARSAMEPKTFSTPEGKVVRAEVYTPEDVRFAFMERTPTAGDNLSKPALFMDGLVVARLESPSPLGLKYIDHLTNNVDMGEMKKWVDFYKQNFGFKVTRHFDISTGRTGLISDVVESQNRKIKVPINEATEKESQVQEFVERFKGAGVQHLALMTEDIIQCMKHMRESGFKFLQVPSTYYDMVPKRVPKFDEDIKVLEELGILLDGEGEGYLLQVFTEETVGPFFFEIIQRKGNEGFGEGNFQALFEAIERDQVDRGVLRPIS